jgi:DNA-binding CsgD family transcriptional regulator
MRRRDPDEAVELWRGLVAGRWSVVDQFDHDGKRFVVAVPNEPRPRFTGRELTAREAQVTALAARGHSNKLIAYELGLSVSTVGAYLASAARKLGAPTRASLVRAWADAARRRR